MIFLGLSLFLATRDPDRTLVTLVHDKLNPAEQVLAQSIQGLANRKGARVWLETKGIQVEILKELQKEDWKVEPAADVWDLLSKFRKEIDGAVVFKLNTPSLSVATGICGPLKAVAVDESLLPTAKAKGLKVLWDARGKREEDALFLFRSKYGKGMVVEQLLDKPGNLRDFAIKHSAFTMDATDSLFRKKVVSQFGPNPIVFGWGRDEYGWISDISSAGGTGVAADWCVNLSALEELPAKTLKPPTQEPVEARGGERYVAFVLSDGDNIQWLTGGFATDSAYYANPLRGQFPLSWEVSPLLSKFAPRVLDYIYKKATPNDDFVAGPGLPGYSFAHQLPDRAALARESAPYMKDAGLSVASFLNQNEGSMGEIKPWMDLKEISSGIYKDYSPYHRRNGELMWTNEKPCMAYRFVLWEGLMGVDDLVRAIEKMPKDYKDPGSFALVNVHAWSFRSGGGPVVAVKQVIDKLSSNTRVITATQLLNLARQHLKP